MENHAESKRERERERERERTAEREGKHPTRVICIHGQLAAVTWLSFVVGVSSNRLSALIKSTPRATATIARFYSTFFLFPFVCFVFLFFSLAQRENTDKDNAPVKMRPVMDQAHRQSFRVSVRSRCFQCVQLLVMWSITFFSRWQGRSHDSS